MNMTSELKEKIQKQKEAREKREAEARLKYNLYQEKEINNLSNYQIMAVKDKFLNKN